MKNYYQVTFTSMDYTEPETVGVRAYNMVSAMKSVKDQYEYDYQLEFILVERDNDVQETIESNFRLDL